MNKIKMSTNGSDGHANSNSGSSTVDLSDKNELPCKRLRSSIGDYLYKTMFKQQVDSDVTLVILEKKWHLHRAIVKQSQYFSKLFLDDWRANTRQNVINIKIDDVNVTHESVDLALGSLYNGTVNLTPENVIPTVATAKFFLLQELTDQCTRMMIETIGKETVTPYYNASITYALSEVTPMAMQWLELNLTLCSIDEDFSFMKNLSPETMNEIISSPYFVIIGRKSRVYCILRKWLYLNLRTANVKLDDFYKNQTWQEPLLLTEEGRPYNAPFETIGIQSMLFCNTYCMHLIKEDNVLPKNCLESALEDFYRHVMNMKDAKDLGPHNVNNDMFEKNCFNLCFNLENYKENQKLNVRSSIFGFDFKFFIEQRKLKITRKRHERRCIRVRKSKRNVMLRVLFLSFDGKVHTNIIKDSGLLTFSMEKGENRDVMDCDENISYPVRMMVKILTVNPIKH